MADERPYQQGEFCWYELATPNAIAAKAFYSELFGYGLFDVPMPEGSYTLLQLQGQDVGGMYEMIGPQFEGVPPHWLAYVWVDDVAAAAAKVRALGGVVHMDTTEVPNVGQTAVLADPSGATFAVFHGSRHPGSARLGFTPGTVGWNELMTPDTEKAKAFYGSLFGWTPEAQPAADFVYTTFRVGTDGVGGMMPMEGPQWEGVPPHWMQYFTVADCDATVASARSLGAEVIVGPMDVPNIGRFAGLKDPTGAHFSVMAWSMPAA
jgi:predicted enzyme related to lactoylglutathione lyase